MEPFFALMRRLFCLLLFSLILVNSSIAATADPDKCKEDLSYEFFWGFAKDTFHITILNSSKYDVVIKRVNMMNKSKEVISSFTPFYENQNILANEVFSVPAFGKRKTVHDTTNVNYKIFDKLRFDCFSIVK